MNSKDEEKKEAEPSYWQSIKEKANAASGSVSNGASNMYQQSEMYPYFIGLFALGCFFIFLALWFLPFIVVAPRKTANLINAGSICIIASLAVLKGP